VKLKSLEQLQATLSQQAVHAPLKAETNVGVKDVVASDPSLAVEEDGTVLQFIFDRR
jgi:hypothetical protein